MAEIDFLLVLRGLILVIEVKGGRISRREGVWLYRDRYGDAHQNWEGPFAQARSAMFALERDLAKRVPGLSTNFGALVITPDQALGSDLEWDAAEHLGPSDMTVSGLEQGLLRSARFWRGRVHTPGSGRDFGDVLHVLRPDFDRVLGLTHVTEALEEAYVSLAEQQYDMLRGAESNPRILVTGGAGSGKTLLAIETARRAAAAGNSVLLTCLSPHVADLMQRATAGSKVVSRGWDDIDEQPPVDVLVVDEAQDLMTVDDALAMELMVKGGLASGSWRLFCDPNSQIHVDGHFDDQVFDEVRGLAHVYELPYNCRNTAPVISQTQQLTGADLGLPRVGFGPAVEYRKYRTDEDAAALIDAEIKRLRQQGVRPCDVVVITLRDTHSESAAALSKSFRTHRLVPGLASDSGSVRLLTAREFKGLESPHVLVVDVDDANDPSRTSRLYVAMTRPRVSLWLAVSEAAWEHFRRGLRSVK